VHADGVDAVFREMSVSILNTERRGK
jgi:hypothetical protein